MINTTGFPSNLSAIFLLAGLIFTKYFMRHVPVVRKRNNKGVYGIGYTNSAFRAQFIKRLIQDKRYRKKNSLINGS